jgi:formylglycine-generating enzyme required for sulfatase activity
MNSDLGFMIDSQQGRNLKSEILNHKFLVRLPTESEWVLAAGGEENNRYPWDEGNTKSQNQNPKNQIENVVARANVKESRLEGTTPVAMYPDGARVISPDVILSEAKNLPIASETLRPFQGDNRIFDLAGNVWEWTSNTFDGSYPGAYFRGGAYYKNAKDANASARFDFYRLAGYLGYGFRVVVASSLFPRI